MRLPVSLRLRDDPWERRVRELDPATDAHAIVQVLTERLFPVDIFVATELAQLETFAIPSISRLLHATREYELRGRRRIDDTKAILIEILREGPGSTHGRAMVEHLNRIHGHYRITNEDYLYTLSRFVLAPTAWIERHGWRPLHRHERDALFRLYMELGRAMRIRELPESFEELSAWSCTYEVTARRYAASNEAVARGLLAALREDLPRAAGGLVEPIVASLLEAETAAALGLKRRAAAPVVAVMWARRWLGRRVTLWNHASFADSRLARYYPTYPHGYVAERLGPRKVLEALERARQE